MEHLYEKLKKNAHSKMYPYHMPGHKRRGWGELPKELYEIDITEIDGFDNLHQPEGILLALQEKASQLYGADESFYLVNGSTGGILSAISCAIPSGGHILMARNCHKSAYHGAYLRNLRISYLYPPYLSEYGIFDAITPQQVHEALENTPDIGAVLIVSPTYEGRIADVRKIAEIVHAKGIPLIVDEAHGAHLGLAENFPKNSCQAGADLVIHSVHKTLPSLTQTALIHVNGTLIDRELLKRFLHIYQSSSPSYLLMASIDNALQHIATDGTEAFGRFSELYRNMLKKLSECRCLKFLPEDWSSQDVGKLLISVKDTNITGKQLYNILLQEYRLQLEMASDSFALAMFTVNDGEEAYQRMTQALLEVDQELEQRLIEWHPADGLNPAPLQHNAIPLVKAWDMAEESVELKDSVGRCVGEFINLYPPGIPLLVPGERMTEALYRNILDYIKQGLTVQGIDIHVEKGITDEKVFIRVLKCEDGEMD